LALVVAFLAFASVVRGEGKLAPFYSLPDDGAWLEYDWQRTLPDGKEQSGTMRLSSVGTKDVDGVRCRWIEITVRSKTGDKETWQRRKLLVEEKAFADGKALEDCVRDCFHHDDANPNATRLSRKRIGEFLRMGIAGDDLTLQVVKEKEEMHTALGKFTTRLVSAGGGAGAHQPEYRAWMTREVPFGVAKFEIRERMDGGAARTLFVATAERSGKEAKGELDETSAR
jgi:hypothetical protein